MASNDKLNLLERTRGEGFEVEFDPPGNGMCFYAAAGHQLDMSASDVQELVFKYLHHHRYDENGDDRLGFLCSVDIGGKKVPNSWTEALDLLKHNYANAMVIRSIPEILQHKVVIVTVHGSSPGEYVKVFVPKKGPYIGTLYFGHTGDHYVALKPLRAEALAMGEEGDKLYHFTDTDLMWMKVAFTVASRAEISQYAKEKPSVGCVIRRSRSKGPPAVLAVGWNGFLPKTPKDTLRDKAAVYDGEHKKHGLTRELGLHAETNALRNCSENPEKATVYVTHVPCYDCAKQLVSHRVKRVFYLFWMDNSESSIKLFKDFDISCIPFPVSSRDDVFRDFSKTFRADHYICKGSTKQDIPKEGSIHLSKEDSTSGTFAELKRSTSEDYPLKVLLEKHWGDKVDKILQEFHEYRNHHNIKIVGVPEKCPEETALDTSDLCVSLFTEMGAKITIHDIDIAQRTAKGGDSDGPRPINCKFVRRLARDSVMSVKQQACNVDPVKIGFSEDTDVSKISICDYDHDSQEMTEGAS